MHPNSGPRSGVPTCRRSLTILFLGCSTLSTGLITGCREHKPEPMKLPPPAVEVAPPVLREVCDYQIFTARTQATQSVDVRPRVSGYLTKIDFKDGEDVKADQVLFEIDDRPYAAALEQAKGQLEIARATLLRTQAELDIGLDTQKNNPGAISKQDLTRRRGARDEAAGSLEVAKGALAQAELNFGWCKVTAPISGRTNRHFVDVGNLITQGETTLTNIVSLKPIWAYFDVDENTVLHVQKLVAQGKLKSARKGTVDADMALGNAADFNYPGVVDFISNQLDPNTGSIRCRAIFPNESETLVAGMFGRIRVPVSAMHTALLIQESAVGMQQGDHFVMVVNDHDVVEQRVVNVGAVHDNLREVMATRLIVQDNAAGAPVFKEAVVLSPTDRIIINGLQRVRPGMTVKPITADMLTLRPIGADAGRNSPATQATH